MQIIIEERKLEDGFDKDGVAAKIDALLATKVFIAAFVEEREDGWHQVTIKPGFQDLQALNQQGLTPMEAFAGQDIRALIVDFENNKELGALSAKYESNGDAGVFAFDDAGGHSYGAYQLASAMGAVANFLRFLETEAPASAAALNAAGGDAGARAGTQAFKDAWKALAADPAFFKQQHGFIKATYYDVFVKHVRDQIGLDIDSRSMAVRNVAWSTAVQHGMHNSIFKRALAGKQIPVGRPGDEMIIAEVYAERSKVGTHFPRVPNLHDNLRNRFAKEKADALAMLA